MSVRNRLRYLAAFALGVMLIQSAQSDAVVAGNVIAALAVAGFALHALLAARLGEHRA